MAPRNGRPVAAGGIRALALAGIVLAASACSDGLLTEAALDDEATLVSPRGIPLPLAVRELEPAVADARERLLPVLRGPAPRLEGALEAVAHAIERLDAEALTAALALLDAALADVDGDATAELEVELDTIRLILSELRQPENRTRAATAGEAGGDR
jgi:hypothetical protein